MEKYFTDPDWTQDDGDTPPKWAVGRKMVGSELEVEYPGTPFETYILTRGHANGVLGSTVKVCGKFKCLVRVFEKVYPKIPIDTQVPDGKGGVKTVTMLTEDINQECREEPPASLSDELLETLLKPQNYEVRLYALKYCHL